MRVAFLVNWRDGAGSGIYHKVAGQAAAWQRQGHEVGLFVTTEPDAVDAWGALPATRFVAARSARRASTLRARQAAARRAEQWGPDVCYTRHGLPYPALLRLARHCPLVIEVNGDDLTELPHVAPHQVAVARLARGRLLRAASGLVHVTEELSRRPSFARYQRPSAVVANGIDLTALPLLPRPTDGPLTLALVGNPRTPWHGADQVVDLARLRPTWAFHVIGPGEAELGPAPLPPNVRVHGLLDRTQLHRVLSGVDVGLGTLALHRKGLQEASALKVREYLALGLPVVLGNADTDFPEGADFLLTVPNAPGGLVGSADEVEAFALRWRGAAVQRRDIGFLDVVEKESARLAFLQDRVRAWTGVPVPR